MDIFPMVKQLLSLRLPIAAMLSTATDRASLAQTNIVASIRIKNAGCGHGHVRTSRQGWRPQRN